MLAFIRDAIRESRTQSGASSLPNWGSCFLLPAWRIDWGGREAAPSVIPAVRQAGVRPTDRFRMRERQPQYRRGTRRTAPFGY
jgi:hypothetical protein